MLNKFKEIQDKSNYIMASGRIFFDEWKDLLMSSFTYQFEKRVKNSVTLSPVVQSSEWFLQLVSKIAQKSLASRLKVGRIMIRLLGAMVNQNTKAFEHAVNELLELGRKLQ
jgi:hypothetical protein